MSQSQALRVVVTGATGNVGTSVMRALGAHPDVDSIVGIARREPDWQAPRTEWIEVDLAEDDLHRHFVDADAVIHLAWLFQPTREPGTTWRTNVLGTIKVLDAVATAGVPALVCASSVGAYSPGVDDEPVDESWPTNGWPTASYTREKAYNERLLDVFERDHPNTRIVRLRPGFLFKRQSAPEQRRLFAGPLMPHQLVRPGLIPTVPQPRGLRFQVTHTDDAAEAYVRAAVGGASGAFNIAAEHVVDTTTLAKLLGASSTPVSASLVRAAVDVAWRVHLVPASPELFDAVMRLPVMDMGRARNELGWAPQYTAEETLAEFLQGTREAEGADTPPLRPSQGWRGRLREFGTGVGKTP